jgi:hypothetical protein
MKNKNISRRSNKINGFDESVFEKIKTRERLAEPNHGYREYRKSKRADGGFKCVSCKNWVSASRESSGVNNRNHCPFCLVSLHVDQTKAGDRLSSCRSRMVAIGLTFKKVSKRYPGEGRGELMLIHRCTGCGMVNINRIAADDNPGLLSILCETSLGLPECLLAELAGQGIQPLDSGGFDAAYFQIFGWQPIEIDLVRSKVKASID